MSNRRGIKRERGEDVSNDRDESNNSSSDPSSAQKRMKFERSFVPSWLDRFEWLVFDKQRNLMFCGLCTKYRKNNAFTEGCQNFRRDNLNKHMATNDHKFCVEQDGLIVSVASPVLDSSPSSSVKPQQQVPSERALSPVTPGGRHSSSDSSRSSGIFSSASSSLPQSPASLPLPSPPAFAATRTPTSTLHAPVPLLPYPSILSAGYMQDPRFHTFHGEPGGDSKMKESLPITPNYLAHPPFPYISGSSNFRLPSEQASSSPSSSHKPPHTGNSTHNHNGRSSTPAQDDSELVLKVRVADSPEKDFIELEIEKSRLSFQYVLSTMCRELNVNPSLVQKLRKLPNTIVRKDKDVFRFVDFQELELVLSSQSGDGYSPRHVDVVY